MSIPRQSFFFWNTGTALPYIRYLTLATFRLQHPDWPMYLFMCRCSDDDKWGQGTFCDFQFNGDELNKICTKLNNEHVPVSEQFHQVAYDVLFHGKEPAPWDAVKFDQQAIEDALKNSKTVEELTLAMQKVVEKRDAREALLVSKGRVKHNYIQEAVQRLGVDIQEYEPADRRVYTMPPPNASDIFSVEILQHRGGWYLDLDQVVMRSLDGLGNHYDFLCGGQTCFYIGIFGSSQGGAVVGDAYNTMLGSYDEKYYNSTGISPLFTKCIQNPEWMRWFKDPRNGINHITSQEHFYPLLASDGANRFWGGDFPIETWGESECVHYYGGNPVSQRFFREVNPSNILDFEGAKNCMSRYIRKISNNGQGLRKILCFE
jgi:hypothetical protein